ncbi:phospholipase A2 inhibitor NAI-like [Anomaloglossus baeobatrachus]|uniref:phospholipase A2 inhibitor NAI-like n=1 Tax=Anomaloglossus baeobatrachus TaxID=238106 RepID=UPI003F50A03B
MKNLVTLLFMILAFVVSVFSYKCYSCLSKHSTKCNETQQTECIGDRCMTCSQLFYNGEKMFKSIYKGCANESLCGAEGSDLMENVKYRFYTTCCTGELCNTDTYNLPNEDPTPNGKTCPSAYCKATLEECKTEKEINCTGSMDRCYDYRGKMRNPDDSVDLYSVKGCTNNVTCKYNFDSAIALTEIHRESLIC